MTLSLGFMAFKSVFLTALRTFLHVCLLSKLERSGKVTAAWVLMM